MPRGCLAGMVRDACDCCWECANLEGQICDLDNTNHFYGKCGEHLECRLDSGDLQHGEVPEPQCACLSHLALCGSDGKTYAQICRFLEVARAHPDANLTVAHEGPCESGSAPGVAVLAAGRRVIPFGKGHKNMSSLTISPGSKLTVSTGTWLCVEAALHGGSPLCCSRAALVHPVPGEVWEQLCQVGVRFTDSIKPSRWGSSRELLANSWRQRWVCAGCGEMWLPSANGNLGWLDLATQFPSPV